MSTVCGLGLHIVGSATRHGHVGQRAEIESPMASAWARAVHQDPRFRSGARSGVQADVHRDARKHRRVRKC